MNIGIYELTPSNKSFISLQNTRPNLKISLALIPLLHSIITVPEFTSLFQLISVSKRVSTIHLSLHLSIYLLLPLTYSFLKDRDLPSCTD